MVMQKMNRILGIKCPLLYMFGVPNEIRTRVTAVKELRFRLT